jgi:uncharacterized C2H2 Zn-finger protein
MASNKAAKSDKPLELCCPRCGYRTNRRGNMKLHVNRKTLCPPKVSNMSKEQVVAATSKMLSAHPDSPTPNVCPDCSQTFTSASGLSRHRNTFCKTREKAMQTMELRLKELEERQNMFDKLLQNVQNTNTQINNNIYTTINNNIIQNTTNNIKLCAFRREDENDIKANKAFMTRCVRRCKKGLLDYIERVHFNPATPQHHNLRPYFLDNTKFVQKYNGHKWELATVSDVFTDMVDDGIAALTEHFELIENTNWLSSEFEHNKSEINEFISIITRKCYRDMAIYSWVIDEAYCKLLNMYKILPITPMVSSIHANAPALATTPISDPVLDYAPVVTPELVTASASAPTFDHVQESAPVGTSELDPTMPESAPASVPDPRDYPDDAFKAHV